MSVYFLSKVLSDVLFLRTIPGIIFSCVVYWMIGQTHPHHHHIIHVLLIWNMQSDVCVSCAGLKSSAETFFIFMFSIVLVSYTAMSMTLAISADQTVVAIANIFLTISFVSMMVKTHTHTHTQAKIQHLTLVSCECTMCHGVKNHTTRIE